MSSCTNTFRNLFPLCTSNVCPTNSGVIVHARAHVLMGCLARFSFSFVTFLKSFSSTYGPFFALLLICSPTEYAGSMLPGYTFTITHSRSADEPDACRTCGDAGLVFRSWRGGYG